MASAEDSPPMVVGAGVDPAFEALGVPAAVLDRDGVVVAANASWRSDPRRAQAGAPYVAGRPTSAPADLDVVLDEGVERVLAGRSERFELEHPVDGPTGRTWYLLVATPTSDGAVVVHIDVTACHDVRDLLDDRAHRDPLTGLPNRRATTERLSAAMSRSRAGGRALTVVFLDLDGFKGVNDRLGHEVGDEVLVAVARRLERTVRANDTLGRWGGDEFVAVVEGGEEAARALAERLHRALAEPVVVAGRRAVVVGVSVGASAVVAGDVPDDALSRADLAMFEAKRGGLDLVFAPAGRRESEQ